MITLYGHPYSGNSRKVHWALEEVELPYRFELVDLMTRAQKAPEFLRLNPAGRVPVIDDAGFVLWESNAILRYLAARYGAKVIGPRDERESALVDQWLFFQAFDVQPNFQRAFMMKFMASMGQPFQESEHARLVGDLQAPLALLDGHLAGKQYVVGDHFTIADIALAEAVGLGAMGGVSIESFANVQSWFSALSSRPSFGKTRPKG